MDNIKCPVCKSDSYFNPELKLYISPCFHKLCEACLHKIFAYGVVPCPECGTELRRINYITSTFEDLEVEREIRIRKFMSKSFTRHLDEFESVTLYNDYLEKFEDTVFELIELNNEKLIKERINALKDEETILNPCILVKNKVNEDNSIKRVKVEHKEIFGIYKDEEPVEVVKIDLEMTKFIISPCEASGMTDRIITDYFVYMSKSEC